MAAIQGNGGSATIGAYNTKLHSWSASINTGPVDTTGFEDGGWVDFVASGCAISGSAMGTLDDTNVSLPAGFYGATVDPDDAVINISLVETAGRSITGYAVVSNVQIFRSQRLGVPSTISFNFVSKKDMTVSL